MTLLEDILFQEALNTRHAIQMDNPEDIRLIEKADQNLKAYDKESCPVCWIRDLEKSPLLIEKNVTNSAEESNARCRCYRCGFINEFLVT